MVWLENASQFLLFLLFLKGMRECIVIYNTDGGKRYPEHQIADWMLIEYNVHHVVK